MKVVQGPLWLNRVSVVEAIAVITFAALVSLFIHFAPYLAERL